MDTQPEYTEFKMDGLLFRISARKIEIFDKPEWDRFPFATVADDWHKCSQPHYVKREDYGV